MSPIVISRHAVERFVERHGGDPADARTLLEAEAPAAVLVRGPYPDGTEHRRLRGTDAVLVVQVDRDGAETVVTVNDWQVGARGWAASLAATAGRVRALVEARLSNNAVQLAAVESKRKNQSDKRLMAEMDLEKHHARAALRLAMRALRDLAFAGHERAAEAMGEVAAVRPDFAHESFFDGGKERAEVAIACAHCVGPQKDGAT